MKPPVVLDTPIPVLPEDALRRLLAACAGKGLRGPPRHRADHRTTAVALERYLPVRARHKDAALPWLWLGLFGRLTAWGLVQMPRRRSRQAGLPELHPPPSSVTRSPTSGLPKAGETPT